MADLPAVPRDARLHSFADLPYTDAALQALARELARVVQARLGLSRKVLALDLDNTLWGGVLGEVGAHSVVLGGLYPGKCYRELQLAARRLREQGVILVLASKNDPELVEQALAKHPEMLLRSDAFAVLAVNWSAKDGNLRQAAESLSLATDSFVFMDDSSFERGAIADALPEIALVAADGDPAHLANSLLNPGFFDVLELTDTDRQRPALYRSRALRSDFAGGFASSEDYLQALEIELALTEVDEFGVPRVAQLAARTNQFNLTGIRFDEATTAAMSIDPEHLVVSLSVRDRFGDEGIVGALWIERREPTWRVLNFVLSCRVLGRGIELAALDWVCAQATAAGAEAVEGRFVSSPKNSAAADFWLRAGFTATEADRVPPQAPGPPRSGTGLDLRAGKEGSARMSEPTEVQQTVESILSDVLRVPVDDLRQQPVLAAYQWDSLNMLEALAQLESSLGVSLDLRFYQQARTVDDLLSLIAEASAGTPAAQR